MQIAKRRELINSPSAQTQLKVCGQKLDRPAIRGFLLTLPLLPLLLGVERAAVACAALIKTARSKVAQMRLIKQKVSAFIAAKCVVKIDYLVAPIFFNYLAKEPFSCLGNIFLSASSIPLSLGTNYSQSFAY
jgi:hypothetical protein